MAVYLSATAKSCKEDREGGEWELLELGSVGGTALGIVAVSERGANSSRNPQSVREQSWAALPGHKGLAVPHKPLESKCLN